MRAQKYFLLSPSRLFKQLSKAIISALVLSSLSSCILLELSFEGLDDDTSEDFSMKQEALGIGAFSLGESDNEEEVGFLAMATKLVARVVVVSSSSSISSPEEYSS